MNRRAKQLFGCCCLFLFFIVYQLHANNAKPGIVDLINKLKPDSLRNEKGKWIQTWVDDPGFDGQGPAVVDVPNGYASFIDSGTGAGTIAHEFAVYYPDTGEAVLAYYYANDQSTYESVLKFYQLRQGKLEQIASLLPKLSCREFAADATKKLFYQNAEISKLKEDPVLPTYSLPRKGTAITAYCDTSMNRFNIEMPLNGQNNLNQEDKMAIISAMDFPMGIEYYWNKKKGHFTIGKKFKHKS